MSWSPSPPDQPRDDTRDDTVYNVPMTRTPHPPRFPGFLLAAVIAGLIGFAALGAILFGGRGAPEGSPTFSSRTPVSGGAGSGAVGSGAPNTTAVPGGSGGPGPTGAATVRPSGPPVAGELVDRVCSEPRQPFDQLRPALLDGFRHLCRESIEAVLRETDLAPDTVRASGWAFTAGDSAGGAAVSHVYIAVDGRARAVRYLVAHGPEGSVASVSEGPAEVSRVSDPLMIYRWSRPRQPDG